MAGLIDLYNKAEKLHDDGKIAEAIGKLNELLEQDESFALAHSALAAYYGKVGQHEDAIRHGQRVCELEPNDPFSLTAMSVTYQRAFAGTGDQQYIAMAEEAMARSQTLQGGGR